MADEADNGTEPERDGNADPADGADGADEQQEAAESADGADGDAPSADGTGPDGTDAGEGTAPDGDGTANREGTAPDEDEVPADGTDPAAGASERDDWSDVDLEPGDFVSGGEYVGNDPPDEDEADGTGADGDGAGADGDGAGADGDGSRSDGDGTGADDEAEAGDDDADADGEDAGGGSPGVHPESNIPPEDAPGRDPDPDSDGIAVPPEVGAEARANAEAADADGTDAEGADADVPEPPEPVEEDGDAPEPDDGNLEPGSRPVPEDRDRPDNMAEATPIERKTGPAEDQEMPLADHVEEMIARLFVVIAIAGVVSVALFPFGEEVIDLLWYQVLPGGDIARPRLYHPLSLVITQLKVASLGGIIVALPVFVYQTYAFMRPGLYPNERRYYLAAIPTSLVLAFVGVTFAYFVVLPAIFTYFLYYTDTVVTIAFALSDTFNLILLLMGYLAVVFQIPLFIMLAIMMGLTTRRWMQNRRLYFWAAFLGISFLFNPDPTGMAPFLVTATMIGLFEGTLLLLRWTGR